MRVVLSLFLQFYVVQVNSCECEVQPWGEWNPPDVSCGSASRSRVCSKNNGWTLGLTCNEKENHVVYESKVPCRKLLSTEISSLTFFRKLMPDYCSVVSMGRMVCL